MTPNEYTDEMVEKLLALANLVKSHGLLTGEENIDYETTERDPKEFIAVKYRVKFVVTDPTTNLPVTVTIETPVKRDEK